MRTGRDGDMGFAEAIIAFMAVTVVLTAFLGLVAQEHPSFSDPTARIPEQMFGGSVVDGKFEPSYEDGLGSFLDMHGFRGIGVTVTVPGGLCDVPPPMTAGEMDGNVYGRTFSAVVSDDAGRSFPVFFEVVLCV